MSCLVIVLKPLKYHSVRNKQEKKKYQCSFKILRNFSDSVLNSVFYWILYSVRAKRFPVRFFPGNQMETTWSFFVCLFFVFLFCFVLFNIMCSFGNTIVCIISNYSLSYFNMLDFTILTKCLKVRHVIQEWVFSVCVGRWTSAVGD